MAHSGPFRLIVLPFDIVSQQADDAWLATAFADSLTFGLRNAENIIIVNRLHSDATADARRLADTLAVRYCVTGTIQRVGDDLRVVARLVDTATGTITLQESVIDRFSNLLSLEESIAGRFAAAFEAPRSGSVPNRTSSLTVYKRVCSRERAAPDWTLSGGGASSRERRDSGCALRGRLGASGQQLCASDVAGCSRRRRPSGVPAQGAERGAPRGGARTVPVRRRRSRWRSCTGGSRRSSSGAWRR